MHPALPRLTTLLPLVFASGALAHSTWVRHVPNGTAVSCQTCHGTGGSTTFNAFGLTFRTATNAGSETTAWATLFDQDADEDGQTNGEELGDPCGVYTSGGTPTRTTDISQPGLATSTSATPSAPDADDDAASDGCDNCPDAANADQADADANGTGDACESGGEGEGEEGEGEGDGGEGEGEGEGEPSVCSSTRVPEGGPDGAALVALVLLGAVSARRRRFAAC